MLISTLIDGRLITPSLPAEPLVPWWSFTKTVLAATALTLVRDGRLDLGASLPEGVFTLRQLLRHEAGLADYGELPEYHAAIANHESAWPAGEMMRRLEGHRLRYTPGTGWRYSNVGFMLVAQIIERAADLPLADAIRQQVLNPLDIATARLATERAELNAGFPGSSLNYDPGWVYHGLLIGPVSEAARLLDGVLAGGLLPDNLLQEMQATRILGGPIAGRPWLAPGYALGLMRGEIKGDLMLAGHTGVGPGSVIAVYRCAVGDSAVCCAAHSTGEDEAGIEKRVAQEIRKALETTR
ncbi:MULTISPECIES: serine hydrolase domain-containing protein [Pseudomonas]|uniref:Beta-lactamase family protein n=1 Tax=Pseudomonas quercus TaxID=2722792 RepID=A0ABX0YDL0_9PSED|nr:MULTISPECIES: serine hydrolase domain-containing protein [Pseudomonas]MBF7142906.1 beta-lactamase family protein [Pseudomonas sp. LY10J]NJP01454.1 beta-lactamase family protein [Pseudomonas quercus]